MQFRGDFKITIGSGKYWFPRFKRHAARETRRGWDECEQGRTTAAAWRSASQIMMVFSRFHAGFGASVQVSASPSTKGHKFDVSVNATNVQCKRSETNPSMPSSKSYKVKMKSVREVYASQGLCVDTCVASLARVGSAHSATCRVERVSPGCRWGLRRRRAPRRGEAAAARGPGVAARAALPASRAQSCSSSRSPPPSASSSGRSSSEYSLTRTHAHTRTSTHTSSCISTQQQMLRPECPGQFCKSRETVWVHSHPESAH